MREIYIKSIALTCGIATSVGASLPIGYALDRLNVNYTQAEVESRLLEQEDQSLRMTSNIARGSISKYSVATEKFIAETLKANTQAIAVLNTQAQTAELMPQALVESGTILASFLLGSLACVGVVRWIHSRIEKHDRIALAGDDSSNSNIVHQDEKRPYLQLIINTEYNKDNPSLDA